MKRALVVVTANAGTERVIREAAQLAAGVDAEMVLVHVTTESDYEERRREMETLSGIETDTYPVERAEAGAEQFARDMAVQALAGFDVDYEVYGVVGPTVERVLEAAEEYDCDHVFVAGRRRSPSGKAVFGDVAQRVILNFPGPVTVLTA